MGKSARTGCAEPSVDGEEMEDQTGERRLKTEQKGASRLDKKVNPYLYKGFLSSPIVTSERFDDDENNDANHQDGGDFIGDAKKSFRARVAVLFKIATPLGHEHV